MRTIRTALTAFLAAVSIQMSAQGIQQMNGSYLEPLQKRDSILIADQLKYGFVLENVKEGTTLAFQDWTEAFGDTLILVRNWELDTLKSSGGKNKGFQYNIDANIIIAPFEPGQYQLPSLSVLRSLPGGNTDTLLFDPQSMLVTTMPVDTATFEIHDIKGQITYPLTFKEVLPYILAVILLGVIIAMAVYFIRKRLMEKAQKNKVMDPPYIIALRKLDNYRGESFWAAEKQKGFYSGITDALREYIESSFGIDAQEMTTAEIFDSLKDCDRISPDLYASTKDLFETADFVKFAKHVVGNEENAKAVPAAVRFVTETYQKEL